MAASASVSRAGTARGRTDHPVRRHRSLRRRPDCRATGGIDAADGIAAIEKNAASYVRDHGAPPAPFAVRAAGTGSAAGTVAFSGSLSAAAGARLARWQGRRGRVLRTADLRAS